MSSMDDRVSSGGEYRIEVESPQDNKSSNAKDLNGVTTSFNTKNNKLVLVLIFSSVGLVFYTAYISIEFNMGLYSSQSEHDAALSSVIAASSASLLLIFLTFSFSRFGRSFFRFLVGDSENGESKERFSISAGGDVIVNKTYEERGVVENKTINETRLIRSIDSETEAVLHDLIKTMLGSRRVQIIQTYLNLAAGGLLVVIGFLILKEITDTSTIDDDNFYRIMAARFSITIVLQVFAFFFLSLYRKGLEEVKYINNELTNVHAKLASVSLATKSNDPQTARNVVEELLKTERNFLLKKGETTVALKEMEMSENSNKNLLGIIDNALNKSGKNKERTIISPG